MQNDKLVRAFLEGEQGMNNNKTLIVRGNELVNYDTVIAVLGETKEVFISNRFYSPTTSKIISLLKREAVGVRVVIEESHEFMNNKEFAGRKAVGSKVSLYGTHIISEYVRL